MMKTAVKGVVALGMCLGLLLAGTSVMAQEGQGQGAATTKYLMAGITQPHCKASRRPAQGQRSCQRQGLGHGRVPCRVPQ